MFERSVPLFFQCSSACREFGFPAIFILRLALIFKVRHILFSREFCPEHGIIEKYPMKITEQAA